METEDKIIRTAVDSSNIASIGYHPLTQKLAVEFKGKGVYHYAKIPQELYDSLMIAPSKGSFLSQQIKGKFECSFIGVEA